MNRPVGHRFGVFTRLKDNADLLRIHCAETTSVARNIIVMRNSKKITNRHIYVFHKPKNSKRTTSASRNESYCQTGA